MALTYGFSMKIIAVLGFVALIGSGCNTPGPYFRGIEPVRITVEGSVFDVRVRGETAEAIRINPEYAPRFGVIRDRARVAAMTVSGCRVKEVLGDQALAIIRLDCDRAGRRRPS